LLNVLKEGHFVGSHTYNHKPLDTLDQQEMVKNFDDSERVFGSLLNGKRTFLFREPYNRRSSISDQEMIRRGYVSINWGRDSDDWRCGSIEENDMPKTEDSKNKKSDEQVVQKVLKGKNTEQNNKSQISSNKSLPSDESIFCEKGSPSLSKRADCVFKPLMRFVSGSSVMSTGTGAIVLLHEHQWTVESMEKFIVYAKAQGYRFVSIAEFMKPETRRYLWNKYECDSVTQWQDMFFETCKQLMTRPDPETSERATDSDALSNVRTDEQIPSSQKQIDEKPSPNSNEPSEATLSTDNDPTSSTEEEATPREQVLPTATPLFLSPEASTTTTSSLQCESHVYLLIFSFVVSFSLMLALVCKYCWKGTKVRHVLRISEDGGATSAV